MVRVLENYRGITPGYTHGKRTVLGRVFSVGMDRSGPIWRVVVECECGTIESIKASHVLNGRSTQCRSCSRTTHGGSSAGLAPAERLYELFMGMRARCENQNHIAYDRYGGRGIRICDEWRHDYGAFREWALSNGYTPGLSIDRKDNDKGYSPENCRWATSIEQGRNKRNNVFMTAFGETQTVADWCRDSRCAVVEATLRKRLKDGWDHEVAISKPSRLAMA